jgi:hypothetical protein
VNIWLGAIGIIASGLSDVGVGAALDATGGEGTDAVVDGDGDACTGGDGAMGAEGDAWAGGDGAAGGEGFAEGVGCVGAEDGRAGALGAGGGRAEDGARLGADENGGAAGGDGVGTIGVGLGACGASGGPAVGKGATVVYWVTMTTGGSARGVVGARATSEDFDDGRTWAVVDAPPSSGPCGSDGLGFVAALEGATGAEAEGNTVVYSVFVTMARVDVEFAATGAAVDRTEIGTDATGACWLELLAPIDDGTGTAGLEMELLTSGELTGVLVSFTVCDAPGWLNPGRPVEFPVAGLLETMGVADTTGFVELLSSGAYVKAGILVALSVPLPTAVTELADRVELGTLGEGTLLLFDDGVTDLGVGEKEGTMLELAATDDGAAGAGVGVK